MIEPVQVLGQPAVRLACADGAQATVLMHGAQVVSWIPAGDVERLYLSPLASADEGQAVRGGVPVIFPQFERRGPLPRHGFARVHEWQWIEGHDRDGHTMGLWRLTDDDATRVQWPHAFEAELCVSIEGASLEIELAVVNTGSTAFDFTAALHTYLLCDDLARTRLHGLYGAAYEDSLDGRTGRQEMHIHILGICGTFMGGLAALAREAGHRVTGCDANVYPPMSDQLRALGIDLIEGW
jgi:glucose-6-phosphate 1-epimerase